MVRSVRSFATGLCFVFVFLLALMLAKPDGAFADPQEGNIFSETNDDYDIGDGTNWTGKLSNVNLSLTGSIDWTDDFNILDWETWGFQLSLTFEEKGNFDIEIMKGQQDYYRSQFHDKGTEFPLSLNVYDKKNAVAGATRPAKMSGTFDDSYTFELIWKAFHFPSNITWNTVHDDKSVKYEFTSIEPTEENLPDGTDFDVYFGIENDIGVAGPALSGVVKPILDGDISFDGGIHAHPVLHRNEFDSSAEYLNDTVEAIHSCTDLGKEGCLSGTADKTMVDNITLYSQLIADFYPYPTFIDRTEIIGTDNPPTIKDLGHFVQSLTWKDPLKFKDACDHIYYKVPVAVWKDQARTVPAPDVYVQVLDVHPDPNVVKYTMGKTGSNPTIANTGGVNLYLPFKEGRYTVFVNPSKSDPQYKGLGGEAEQPSDMRRGVNERVDIILKVEEKLQYLVEKSWFIDLEQNDKPDSIDVLLQSKKTDGGDDEWQDIETKTLNRGNSWECYFSAPKYTYDDEGRKLIQYRVRELKEEDGSSGTSPGSRVVESSVEYTVPAYTTLAGEEVSEHKTKYLVEYKEEKEGDDQILVTIKNSAVLDFTLEKLWENFKDKDKPDSVYLALCYRVNSKYLDKLPPNPYKRVAEVWIPVFAPISGDMIDILSLLDLDWIEKVDPTGITKKLKVPLAMGIANEDNDWKLKFTTYKYGWTIVPEIPVDFKAMELTSAIVTDVVELLTGFDIPISASINPDEGSLYISVPIKPMPIPGLNRDWDRYAIIINIYTGGENAIAGVKYWVDDTEDDRPEKLYIHVKDPDTKEEICDPVELNKEDFAGQDYWIWTLTESQTKTGELDPDKTYLISESFPEGYSSSYACEVDGHNLTNTKDKKLKLVITKEFQPEDDAKYPDSVEIQIKNNKGETIGRDSYPLNPHISTDRKIELIDGEDGVILNQEDLNALAITEHVSGGFPYEWLPEITGPVRSTDDEYVIYTYKIINHLQTNVELDLKKEWAGSAGHSDQVELTLERSTTASPVPEVIGTVTLSQDNGWQAYVSQDSEGNPLKRYDQSGLEYTYTAEEDVPEGYRCTVTETKEEKEIPYEVIWHIKVTNTLYEPVLVKGTKTWVDGDGSTRPASFRVRLMTETGPALDEHGNMIEEEVTGSPSESEWPFAFSKKVPKEDGNGNLIRYSVMEYSGIDPASGALIPLDGYTAYYADPVLDSDVWTCDITNTRICTITYDPNGGTIRGSTDPVKEQHRYGDVITIIDAPVRDGYRFLYWKGSQYSPGDRYTVTGDHTFIAQWEKDDPLYYPFTFTKIWVGRTEDSLSWTLYNEDGTPRHKAFNKRVISDTEWRYSAWFPSMQDYYLIENVPNRYRVRYVNVGIHAGETDRLYNGGTIINYWIPKTGDRSGLLWWLGAVLLGCALLGGLCLAGKKKRSRK